MVFLADGIVMIKRASEEEWTGGMKQSVKTGFKFETVEMVSLTNGKGGQVWPLGPDYSVVKCLSVSTRRI